MRGESDGLRLGYRVSGPDIENRSAGLGERTRQRGGFVLPVEDGHEAIIWSLGNPECWRLVNASALKIRAGEQAMRVGKLHGFCHALNPFLREFGEVAGDLDGRSADRAEVQPTLPSGVVEVWAPADGVDVREDRATAHEEVRIERPERDAAGQIPVALADILGVAEVVGFESDEGMPGAADHAPAKETVLGKMLAERGEEAALGLKRGERAAEKVAFSLEGEG